MAQRRMFSLKIVDTDDFLNMPISARLLYYDLSMRADDDGFVNSPQKILKIVGASIDDFKVLIAKQYIFPFDNGICVIRDWKIHNYIQKDRYEPTRYTKELNTLCLAEDGSYSQKECMDTKCIQDVSNLDTQVRLGKDRLGKDRLGKDRLGKDRIDICQKKNSFEYSSAFLNIWENVYPHTSDRGSKIQSYKNWCRLLNEGVPEQDLISAAINYKTHCELKKTRMPYKCSNFYGEARYFESFKVINITKAQQEALNEQRNGGKPAGYEVMRAVIAGKIESTTKGGEDI